MLRGGERKEKSPSGSRAPEGRHGRSGACPLPAAPVGMPVSSVASIVSPDARAGTAVHPRWRSHDHGRPPHHPRGGGAHRQRGSHHDGWGGDRDTKAHGDPDSGIRGPRQRQGGQSDHGEQRQESNQLVCVWPGWYPSVRSLQKHKRNQGRYARMAMYGVPHALIHAWSPGAGPLRHSGTGASMRAKEHAARQALDSPWEGGHRHGRVRVGAGAGSLDGGRVLLGSLRRAIAISSASSRGCRAYRPPPPPHLLVPDALRSPRQCPAPLPSPRPPYAVSASPRLHQSPAACSRAWLSKTNTPSSSSPPGRVSFSM